MRIRCSTQFDITTTGVTGHHKPARMPFVDKSGQTIADEHNWNQARNRQRNYETLLQIVSLRTQIDQVTVSIRRNGLWEFEFTVENDSIFATDTDMFGILKSDCKDVPMLTGLSEIDKLSNFLAPDVNVWFEQIPVNINYDRDN